MKDFFKSFFAALLALIIFTGLIFLVVGGIVAGISSQFEDKKEGIKPNSVLRLNVNYAMPEQTQSGLPTGLSLLNFNLDQALGLNDILAIIKNAETDDNIKGIYLELGINMNSYAKLQEVRDALADFKMKSGKFVIGYGEIITQNAYFLASVGDGVYLNPSGTIEFKGLSAQLTFYKGTLDKLGISTQIFYDGKFKSATEPFRYDKMSEENRLQLGEFLNGLNDFNLSEIATSRNKSVDDFKAIAENLSAWYPSFALQCGLIDGLKYEDEMYDELKLKLGLGNSDSVPFINAPAYINSFKKVETAFDVKTKENTIALVYAEGTIIDGEGSNGYLGSKTFAQTMKAVREDDHIKAVVLRINSPGGSALASDVMWREIEITKKLKPIVVSMGDYAASGGYMISCNANQVFAQPNTLTGSIGVFLILPDLSKFLNDKIGVTFDTEKTAQYADFPTITRPVSINEGLLLQAGVDSTYLKFKKMVANGRGKTMEEIEAVAQGRIWTGVKAKEIGLVDELGGIDEAIRSAAELVKLEEYTIAEFPRQEQSFWESMIFNATKDAQTQLLQNQLGILYPQFKTVSMLLQRPVMQTKLPFEIEIK